MEFLGPFRPFRVTEPRHFLIIILWLAKIMLLKHKRSYFEKREGHFFGRFRPFRVTEPRHFQIVCYFPAKNDANTSLPLSQPARHDSPKDTFF